MDVPTEVFRAIADPTRRAILAQLSAGSRPAGDIAASFAVSRPAVSRHLKILRDADLVTERRHGNYRIYELNPASLRTIDGWLEAFRPFWRHTLLRLKAHAEKREAARGKPKRVP